MQPRASGCDKETPSCQMTLAIGTSRTVPRRGRRQMTGVLAQPFWYSVPSILPSDAICRTLFTR